MKKEEYWFSNVEIEVNSRCNRRCAYCPVSILPVPSVPVFMEDAVLDRILGELAGVGYSGTFSYHFYNEPLLRRDLERLVEKVCTALPETFQLLFTNGDFLTDARYRSLREAGIDHLIVTSHSGEIVPPRERQTVQYPDDLTLTNRGGLMVEVAVQNQPIQAPCFAPSDFLTVTVTGDVVLCCDDSERKHVMGSLMTTSLRDVWFSEKFVKLREALQGGDRANATEMCKICSNTEFIGPGENYQSSIIQREKTPR